MMRLNCKTVALISATILLALCSVACAPANEVVLASTPEPTPTATATPTPVPTPTPAPTPEPTPEMTRAEALKKLRITSDELYCFADLIVYECKLKNGREVKFLACTRLRSKDDAFVDLNATDYEPFAEYYPDGILQMWQYDIMDAVDIKLIPKFLEGAEITSTYGACDVPWVYEERGIELPESVYIDHITKYMADGADPYVLAEDNLTALDCANFLLDICPIDQMVWAKDYIEDFEESTE